MSAKEYVIHIKRASGTWLTYGLPADDVERTISEIMSSASAFSVKLRANEMSRVVFNRANIAGVVIEETNIAKPYLWTYGNVDAVPLLNASDAYKDAIALGL